jgi:hypothetical protein
MVCRSGKRETYGLSRGGQKSIYPKKYKAKRKSLKKINVPKTQPRCRVNQKLINKYGATQPRCHVNEKLINKYGIPQGFSSLISIDLLLAVNRVQITMSLHKNMFLCSDIVICLK